MLPICYTEWWHLHWCPLSLQGRGDRIWTGTAIPVPKLSQIHACLQNKGWERIRRPGFLSGYCQVKFASFGPQATLLMTWKKPTSEMDVMGSVLPFDHCGYWPSNPPCTGFCTSTERSCRLSWDPSLEYNHLWCSTQKLNCPSLHLLTPMQTQRHLYTNGFQGTSQENRKNLDFHQTNAATSVLKPWKMTSQMSHHTGTPAGSHVLHHLPQH